MSDRWASFVAGAITPPVDDPFVRVLRERLAGGCRVVRVNFAGGERAEYVVLLDCHKQLSEMRLPHSQSFTRWSLEAGVRMASVEDETRRFSVLFGERLAPIEQQAGREHFRSVVVQYVRGLAPPQAMLRLGGYSVIEPSPGATSERTSSAIAAVFESLARALGESLGYPPREAGAVLDSALADYLARMLGEGLDVSASRRA